MVRCALTGTPGTGKTSISKLLDTDIVHLSDYYESSSNEKTDEGEWLIELDLLDDNIRDLSRNEGVFEGHTAHFLSDIDQVIILRCDPFVLKERLDERDYSKEKVMENLEAEALNIIYIEALDNIDKEKIFQFDTTNKSTEESAKIIKNFMAGNVKLEETFDYSERIMDWY